MKPMWKWKLCWMPDSDHVIPIGTTRTTSAICSVFIALRGISQYEKYWKKWVQERQAICQHVCLFKKSYYNLLAEISLCRYQIQPDFSYSQPFSISEVLFYREEADWKIWIPKDFQLNHNFIILASFPKTVRLVSLEALSVRASFFLMFLNF